MSNSPSFEDAAVLEFFQTSTGNLLAAEAAAGVGHHVALSVVGTERLPDSGYFRAKIAQETADRGLLDPVLDRARDAVLRVRHAASPTRPPTATRSGCAPVLFQPIAGDDVAQAVGRIAVGAPLDGRVEVAGPTQFRMDEFFRQALAARNDAREVVTDPHAQLLRRRTLTSGTWYRAADAVLGEIRLPGVGRAGYGPDGAMSTPTGDPVMIGLESEVELEIELVESSRSAIFPTRRHRSGSLDPSDVAREEVGLRNILGAVDAMERTGRGDPEGRR